MRLLIVEDEQRIARNLKRAYESDPSFAADMLFDGSSARSRIMSGEPYDLVILDRRLPDMDGLDLLLELRGGGVKIPVLVLTAIGGKEEIIKGLDYGCDDYLVKPFDMGELLARSKALIRRSREHPDPVLRVGDLSVDTRSHSVTRAGRPIELTGMEYRLLEYLAYHQSAVVGRAELMEHLYDFNWEKFSNVIEHYVYSLRTKMEAAGEPRILNTLRGQGYMLGSPE